VDRTKQEDKEKKRLTAKTYSIKLIAFLFISSATLAKHDVAEAKKANMSFSLLTLCAKNSLNLFYSLSS
jgi:hypothetical protein